MRLCWIRVFLPVSVAIVACATSGYAQTADVAARDATARGASATAPAEAAGKRALTFLDVMKFRQIKSPVLASTGTAVAYQSQPDRGDGEVIDPAPKQGVVLLELKSGKQTVHERVQSVVFSKDSAWVAWRHYQPAKKDAADPDASKAKSDDASKGAEATTTPKANKMRDAGTPLKVWRLGSAAPMVATDHAIHFAFRPDSKSLFYAVAEPTGASNGLYRRSLDSQPGEAHPVMVRANHVVTAMAWTENGDRFAAADAPHRRH